MKSSLCFGGIAVVLAISGCSSGSAGSRLRASEKGPALDMGSAIFSSGYQLKPTEQACLFEIDSRLNGAVQSILFDWHAEDLLENLIERRELDILLMEVIHVGAGECANGSQRELLTAIQSQNGAYLQSRLSSALITRADTQPTAQGAIDVISRHDPREGEGQRLRRSLLDIYEEMLTAGTIDPLSYAGLVDNISIRETGKQQYGSYMACFEGEWVFEPEVSDAETLVERRAAILTDEVWPTPLPEFCKAERSP